MAELPVISGDKCMAALERFGYRIARIRGSHVRMRRSGRAPVTVPKHRVLDRGTLRAILRTAEINVEEFNNALKS